MSKLTANDLKTKGVSILDEALKEDQEATISVRGRDTYVVLDMERYNHLRVCELEAAYKETVDEIESGNFVEESVNDHMKRLDEDL